MMRGSHLKGLGNLVIHRTAIKILFYRYMVRALFEKGLTKMGLTVRIKGLNAEQTYDCGYAMFMVYRQKVAKMAYGQPLAAYYKMDRNLTDSETEEWNAKCNNDLDIFLWHSDCDGKFTPQECRKIYNAMKDIKIDMQGHNYGVMKPYNMHEHWLTMFKYCADKRLTMYFC